MTTSNETARSEDWGGRLSPGDVHDVLFTRAGLGRRGYEEAEVDVFLERVQQEITQLIAEKADLRDEVSRLKGQLARAGSAPATGGLNKEEAQLQAVRLLAAAQQTADTYVADAEKYSQRVAADARQHSEEILGEARRAAQSMVKQAETLARDAAERTVEGTAVPTGEVDRQQLDQQIAYLKTFSQVCRVQLRAYLEALLRDVEEEWGKADPGVVLTVPAPARPPELAPASDGAAGAEAPAPALDEAPASGADAAVPAQGTKAVAAPAGKRVAKSEPAAAPAAGPLEADPEAEQSSVDVDLTEAEPAPNGSRPGRRSGTVSHSR